MVLTWSHDPDPKLIRAKVREYLKKEWPLHGIEADGEPVLLEIPKKDEYLDYTLDDGKIIKKTEEKFIFRE